MTQRFQGDVDKLTERIRKDDRNVALYRKRLHLYSYYLLRINFDNSDWELYANKAEADLSRIIELEPAE